MDLKLFVCSDLDLPHPLRTKHLSTISARLFVTEKLETKKPLKYAGNKVFNVILENEPGKVDVNDHGTRMQM